MKRSKRLYVLLGTAVVLAAATIGVLNYEEKKEEIKNSGEVVFEVAAEDVTGISWECSSNALAFTKEENWKYDDDESFPVEDEQVEDLLTWFESVEASFVIENVEDFGQYGLDNPECSILLKTEEETYEILLGDFSTMDSERYISVGDGNVYLAVTDPYDNFDVALSDFIAHDEIPDVTEADKITFEGEENYVITLEDESITYHEDDLYYTDVDGLQKPLSADDVKSYLNAVENLDLTDYKTYNADEKELEEYGLDEPEMTITIRYPQEDEEEELVNETFTLHISCDSKDRDADEDDEISAYVRIGESSLIYEITSTEYKSLMAASYDELRHEELFWADFELVTKMEITLEGETYTVEPDGKDDDKVYQLEENEISADELESAVSALEAESFTKDESDGKEEISLTLYLDHDNVSEVTLVFYRHDGSSCLAVIDGTTRVYVDRSQVVDLIETVNTLILN